MSGGFSRFSPVLAQVIHRSYLAAMEFSEYIAWTLLAMIGTALIVLPIAARMAGTKTRERAITADAAQAKRLAALEATVIELAEDLKRIRSRYVMRERRAQADQLELEPDWRTDPAGWRAYQDRRISARLNGGKRDD